MAAIGQDILNQVVCHAPKVGVLGASEAAAGRRESATEDCQASENGASRGCLTDRA